MYLLIVFSRLATDSLNGFSNIVVNRVLSVRCAINLRYFFLVGFDNSPHDMLPSCNPFRLQCWYATNQLYQSLNDDILCVTKCEVT